MIKAARALLLLVCLPLVAGCVALYKPYLSNAAGKVRLKMTGGASVVGQLWPIVDDQCGQRVLLPLLLPFVEPVSTASRPHDGTQVVASYARAGMKGSPDPARSDVSELQLAPGRYLFALLNTTGGYGSTTWHCGVSVVADIDPRRQYEIELRLEGSVGAPQCRIVATRLDEQGGHELGRPYTLLAGKACPA